MVKVLRQCITTKKQRIESIRITTTIMTNVSAASPLSVSNVSKKQKYYVPFFFNSIFVIVTFSGDFIISIAMNTSENML